MPSRHLQDTLQTRSTDISDIFYTPIRQPIITHVGPFLMLEVRVVFSRGTPAQHLTLSGVCVVSPGLIRCSDRSTRQLYSKSQVYSTVHVYTQPWAQHSHE